MGRIGERWIGESNVQQVRGPVAIPALAGSFGVCDYKLYEAYTPGRRFSQEAPFLLVWLHGQSDMHVISQNEIAAMASKFNRRLVCLAPTNPGKCNGNEFFWAQAFNKEQNKNGLGFVYGQMNYEVLGTFCSLIQQVALEAGAERTILGGYSMGGFGAFQLAGYRPDLFDAIFSIAGHGVGTLLHPSEGFNCPQPDGEIAFRRFLDTHAPNLAKVPILIAIHAKTDTLSSYHDMEVIVDRVRSHGGNAVLVTVPEELANTDNAGKKKSSMSHGYYKFALVRETSEAAVYGPIKTILWSDACQYRREIAAMEADMAAVNAAARAKLDAENAKLAAEKKAKEDEEKKVRDEEKRKEDEDKQRRMKLLDQYLQAGDKGEVGAVVALDGGDKKRDLSPDDSSDDEKKKIKKQKKAEKKEKEKQEAAKLAEQKRKRIQERRAKRSEGADGNKTVVVDIEPAPVVEKVAPMSDEAKRQEMRERRKKLLEQNK